MNDDDKLWTRPMLSGLVLVGFCLGMATAGVISSAVQMFDTNKRLLNINAQLLDDVERVTATNAARLEELRARIDNLGDGGGR